jgi:hypothetical protein
MTRKPYRIVSQSAPAWEPGGNPSRAPAPSPAPPATLADVPSESDSDEAAVRACFTTRTLCQWLGISIRSWTRAAALGLTPAPDLVVGRSPRWSPSTIKRWLKTHPKLPGRGGHHAV